MEKAKDKAKVMDVSRLKKAAARMVPSRQMLTETNSGDSEQAEVPDSPLLIDSHKTIAPVDDNLQAADAIPEPATASAADAQPENSPAEPVPPATKPTTTDAAATDADQSPTDDAASPAKDTAPAIAQAAQANVRQQQIEKYIDEHQFYLPVQAAARKKSIKISGLLTVLVFLLACLLIDLMIDSGAILLVQRIPHTHFFTNGSS